MPTARSILTDRTAACLALVVLLVTAGAFLNRHLLDDTHSPMAEGPFYINKVLAPATYDLVMCGNSRVLQSLSPEAMNGPLPETRILNLGLDGACLTPEMFAVIESKLDPASPRPMVLLGVEPGTLEEYSSANRKLNVERNRSGEAVFLARHGGDWTRGFAPVRPYDVLNRLSLWLRGPTIEQPVFHHEFHPDGWKASFREPENVDRILELLRIEHGAESADRPKIPLPFKDDLFRQVRTWSERGIRVFGVRIPAAAPIRAFEEARYDFDEADIAYRFEAAGGTWITIEPDRYRTYDGSHLRKDAAQTFSRDVAAAMAEALAGEP